MATILVVEDEGIVAEELGVTITAFGHEVMAQVSSADEALAAVSSRVPDLVLMDIRLRGRLDGISTASALSRLGFDVPVVFLTACADDETLGRLTAVRASGYVLKPYDRRLLKVAMETALGKSADDRHFRERERWLTRTLADCGRFSPPADGAGGADSAADERLRLHVAVESAFDGFVRTDAERRMLYVSKALADNLEHEAVALVGQHDDTLIHPESRGDVATALAQLPVRPRSTVNVTMLTRTGRRKHMAMVVVAAPAGQSGAYAFISDRQEQHHLEEDLRTANRALEQTQQVLRDMAVRDPLTGLLNRREFSRFLSDEVGRCLRHGRFMSLLMLDVDHFKAVNDRAGHPAGDEVLKAISQAIMTDVRSIDRACRYGGEEFALILPETREDDALFIAERLRTKIGRLEIPIPSSTGAPLRITISAGVASLPGDSDSVDGLIRSADAALYQAKTAGRNRTIVAGAVRDTGKSQPPEAELV